MKDAQPSTSLRTFLIIWAGQSASVLGTEMTNFALTLWAWSLTGQATPLAMILFFARIPRVIAAAVAGPLVDGRSQFLGCYWTRKQLMMLGDGAAGCSTLVILFLLLTQQLEIWHLYVSALFNGLFSYVQELAYSASMSMIVPKQHYARATAMESYITYSGSEILAPVLSGGLYAFAGLQGVLLVDLATFVIAISTVLRMKIPQPPALKAEKAQEPLWQELTFGFRYLWKRPSLLAVLLFLLSTNLMATTAWAIHSPMILARSGNDATALASVQSAVGIGGVVGAAVLSVWGGPKRRIHGLLLGSALGDFSSMVLGLARSQPAWMVAGFCSAFCSPFFGSSNQSIWLSKVEPALQGRVFATRYLIAQITSPLGFVIAGPLADHWFSPAMQPGGRLLPWLGGMFGSGPGAGMAMQYTLFSFLGVLVGLAGYGFQRLRNVETLVPDHDARAAPMSKVT